MKKDFEELAKKLREAALIMADIERKGIRFCDSSVKPARPEYPCGDIIIQTYSGIIKVARSIATGTSFDLSSGERPTMCLELPEDFEDIEIIQLVDDDGVLR